MKTWLQLLPLIKPEAQLVIEHERGGRDTDRVCSGEAIGPHYVSCAGGTYSLRNGWHVLGGKRIVDVREVPDKERIRMVSEREKLIASMVKPRPQAHA